MLIAIMLNVVILSDVACIVLYGTCDLSVGRNVYSKINRENILSLGHLDYLGLSFYNCHKYFL